MKILFEFFRNMRGTDIARASPPKPGCSKEDEKIIERIISSSTNASHGKNNL